ncbi:MAG: hypothetical protein ABEJ07_04925 [Candidatus Nanohaloarchaea archaeon]
MSSKARGTQPEIESHRPIREKILFRDWISEILAEFERKDQLNDVEKLVDRIDGKQKQNHTYFRASRDVERRFLQSLANKGVVKNWEDRLYRLEDGFETVKERVEQHSSRGNDARELIAEMKVEDRYSDSPVTARDARESDLMSTENPYLDRFERWSWAQWRAGIDGHQKLEADVMLERLKDEIHRYNSDKDDIDDYDIPAGPELDDETDAPCERSFRNHDEFEGYDDALRQIGFYRLKNW